MSDETESRRAMTDYIEQRAAAKRGTTVEQMRADYGYRADEATS
jgi:hypothetical protein